MHSLEASANVAVSMALGKWLARAGTNACPASFSLSPFVLSTVVADTASERAAVHESLAPGGESGGGVVSIGVFFVGIIIESDTTNCCCTGTVSGLPCFALRFGFLVFVFLFF